MVVPSFTCVGFQGIWLKTNTYGDIPNQVLYCVLKPYGKNFALRDQLLYFPSTSVLMNCPIIRFVPSIRPLVQGAYIVLGLNLFSKYLHRCVRSVFMYSDPLSDRNSPGSPNFIMQCSKNAVYA